MPNPEQEYNDKVRAMTEEEDRKDRLAGMSDDEILAEWARAVAALRAKTRPDWGDLHPAPGEPLAGSLLPKQIPERSERGFLKEQSATYSVPVGSSWDTQPTIHWAGEPPDAADGLASMEKPFSAHVTMLHNANPNSPEYKQVQALYGPARIAYARKNNIDMNTGEPKK